MRILGVYANRTNLLDPPPVGLMLVAQNAIDHGHEFSIVDLLMAKDRDRALREALARTKPDLVAFSFRNLDNQDMLAPDSYVEDYRRWVTMANAAAPTVMGGSAFSTYPREMMDTVPATYGIAGQAESTFSLFLEELYAGRRPFTAPGVHWREGAAVHATAGVLTGYPAMSGRLNWDLIDRRKYRGGTNMSYAVITKTGCPYECLFCDTHVTWGDRFVPRDPAAIVDELRENQTRWKMNGRGYFFVDAIFNEPLDWAKAVLEAIIRADLHIGFSCVIEPTHFDREFMALLVRAGCLMGTGLLVSASDPVLEANRKTFRQADLVRFFDTCRAVKLPFMPQYMLGVPGETRETVTQTLEFAAALPMVMTSVGLGARIQRATGLYDAALSAGLISADDNLLYPKFYWSQTVPLDWAQAQVKQFEKKKRTAYGDWVRYLWRSMAVGFRN